jgi:hypothetical protein
MAYIDHGATDGTEVAASSSTDTPVRRVLVRPPTLRRVPAPHPPLYPPPMRVYLREVRKLNDWRKDLSCAQLLEMRLVIAESLQKEMDDEFDKRQTTHLEEMARSNEHGLELDKRLKAHVGEQAILAFAKEQMDEAKARWQDPPR